MNSSTQMDKRDGDSYPNKKDHPNIVVRIMRDDLKSFRFFQRVIACICILIPLFLRLSDNDKYYPNKSQAAKVAELAKAVELDSVNCGYGPDNSNEICKDKFGFRSSLSEYVYSSNSYIFGMLYCMAAMLFMFNGAVFFKSRKHLEKDNQGKWYNVVLGFCLLCIIFNPPHERPIWHYSFTVLFFVGNILVIAFLHNKKYRVISRVLVLLTVIALVLALFPPRFISILLAEWISLTAIAVHLILEAKASTRLGESSSHEVHTRDHASLDRLTGTT